jgi:hypothetical protein
MVCRVRPAGVVAGAAICLLLTVCGCQKEQTGAAAPQAKAKLLPLAPAAQSQAGTPGKDSSQAVPETQKVRAARPEAKPDQKQAGPAVELALKFSVGQTATYKVTAETQKSIQWLGPASARPASFKDGRSGNHVEITFEQRVRQVRDDGGAVLDVTIKALKYTGEMRSDTAVDFDSDRDRDPNHSLARLIGRKYGLQMSAQGQVAALLDVEPVRQAVRGGKVGEDTALKLLSDEEIKDRHEITPLAALKKNPVRPGQTWSDIRSFSFGMMGAKSFERVYTFKGVEEAQGGRRAVVEMKAIPSAAAAARVHKEQTASLFSTMFDNVESYEGRLDLDLDHGQVRRYIEEMQTEWTIADPAGAPTGGRPAALKMGARRLHQLELVP